MATEAGGDIATPSPEPSKFAAYQNPALAAALSLTSNQPSKSTFRFVFALSSLSAVSLLSVASRDWEYEFQGKLFGNLSEDVALLRSILSYLADVSHTTDMLVKVVQTVSGIVFLGTMFCLYKMMSVHRARSSMLSSPTKGPGDQLHLTSHQLGLLGLKLEVETATIGSSRKPPKSKASAKSSPSELLVPLHPAITDSNQKSRMSLDKSTNSSGNKINSFATQSKTQGSPSSSYLVPAVSTPSQSIKISPGKDATVKTPWSSKRGVSKEITTEDQLEQFLADVDEKITESAGKQSTPTPTVGGFGIASPATVPSSANASGATRSTPLRPVRMSPGSQKFTTPPKKGEGELPPPLSLEESIEAFRHLGIYPQIEQWRDRLRQWFSLVLLNPLLQKTETSHKKVIQAAARLNISLTVSEVGSDQAASTIPVTAPPVDRIKEWQSTVTVDEGGLLNQLRATLVQALNMSLSRLPQQGPQQNPSISLMQECVDAITEHQRLQSLLKGEWIKVLLPQSSLRADYMVKRIRELADGTCLRNYDYLKSSPELPSDSHILLYLFCAFLEHPKWMLHVDPSSYAGAQSSKNPLFLGVLPPKEAFPEKYIAVISSIPSVLHPGACVLAVGKQTSPVFALYWDKKLQFCLQGRTALWDSILLLCHRIKVGYGCVVRGMHLGSSALSILPVIDSDDED